jgi:hypothetical protein|tara:strand:- start:24 stop:782 length:759 start_codon:yes stop_codon:yes gene_type:complete
MDTGSLEYNVICVKWGDKFSPEHVNRLYRMAKKNISLPFNFYCWTEDTAGLYDEINIVPLDETLDLKAWWWKLTLFKKNNLKGINLFLDLDVVIQNNIDHLFNKVEHDKLVLIDRSISSLLENTLKHSWMDIRNKITTTSWNSSIMIWYNNENCDLYEKFIFNIKLYTKLYIGIDRFFTHEISKNKFLDIGTDNYYMRCSIIPNVKYGKSNLSYIRKNNKLITLFFDPNKPICIFNGCHQKEFYKNMEDYLL